MSKAACVHQTAKDRDSLKRLAAAPHSHNQYERNEIEIKNTYLSRTYRKAMNTRANGIGYQTCVWFV